VSEFYHTPAGALNWPIGEKRLGDVHPGLPSPLGAGTAGA